MTIQQQTKTCPRCGGTGHHSFNLVHGTVCFKCGGKGLVLANPRKAGCKVTSQFEYAEAGDVVQYNGYGTCKVISVDHGEFRSKAGIVYPQRVILESLIDGKQGKICRWEKPTETTMGGRKMRVNKLTNVWYPVVEE
jgi:hypothetical protein